jgi:hypothetical protein
MSSRSRDTSEAFAHAHGSTAEVAARETSNPDADAETRRLFETIDAMDAAALAAYFTPDGSFRFGNAEPVVGREGIEQAVAGFFSAIGGLRHRITGIWAGSWEHGVVRSVEAEVTYRRKDGTHTLPLPATSTIRMKSDQVHDYRVFVDLTPLFSAESDQTAGAGGERST